MFSTVCTQCVQRRSRMKPIKFACKGQVKNAFWNYAVLEHFTVSKHNVETFF